MHGLLPKGRCLVRFVFVQKAYLLILLESVLVFVLVLACEACLAFAVHCCLPSCSYQSDQSAIHLHLTAAVAQTDPRCREICVFSASRSECYHSVANANFSCECWQCKIMLFLKFRLRFLPTT